MLAAATFWPVAISASFHDVSIVARRRPDSQHPCSLFNKIPRVNNWPNLTRCSQCATGCFAATPASLPWFGGSNEIMRFGWVGASHNENQRIAARSVGQNIDSDAAETSLLQIQSDDRRMDLEVRGASPSPFRHLYSCTKVIRIEPFRLDVRCRYPASAGQPDASFPPLALVCR